MQSRCHSHWHPHEPGGIGLPLVKQGLLVGSGQVEVWSAWPWWQGT